MAHALASPSSAGMWMTCPASITKANGRTRPSSVYAREGTAAHKIAEMVAGGDIPGAVVLIGQGDQVLYQRAFGSRTLVPHPAPMPLDAVFDIASLTKPLGTTLAVMSLVERGAVKLDAPTLRVPIPPPPVTTYATPFWGTMRS